MDIALCICAMEPLSKVCGTAAVRQRGGIKATHEDIVPSLIPYDGWISALYLVRGYRLSVQRLFRLKTKVVVRMCRCRQ